METLLFLLFAAILIFLNAFFVLAEFSSVKIRPTQIEVLIAQGNRKAIRAKKILDHLDEYLSVCQVGITLASIGLGFVGEPAFVAWLHPLISFLGNGLFTEVLAHGIAITVSFIMVSFLHIVAGELIPKSIAIRSTEKSVLWISTPMLIFRFLFAVPIWVLNSTVNVILGLFRLSSLGVHAAHSESEIRAILDQSQSSGILSFRSLLILENVLDFGALTVRNAMKVKRLVKCVSLEWSLSEVRKFIAENRHSRYPVLAQGSEEPLGFIHLKDLYFAEEKKQIKELIRPCSKVNEHESLEKLLSLMQRKGHHMVLVYDNQNRWSGMITMEDAIEEVIGMVEEEYPVETPVNLSDFLTPERVLLDVEGKSILETVAKALAAFPQDKLPVSKELILKHVAEREKLGSSYVGHHLAIPHARLENLERPLVFLLRLKNEMPAPTGKRDETIRFLFLLLTPATSARIHQILLSHIGGIYDSDFLETRLEEAETAAQIHEIIITTEQIVLG